MDIKKIVDRIPKESYVNVSDYPTTNRIDDINAFYLYLIELAVQIGSKVPISKAETTTETFTVVAGSNVFTRTIKDVPILRVDFKYDGNDQYNPITHDQSRLIGGINVGKTRYFANEKQFFVEEGSAGTLRITYARGGVTLFTDADYALGAGWPSPDFLPETFHDLLWLFPSIQKTKLPEVKSNLIDRYKLLMDLYMNHYKRDSATDTVFVTEEQEKGNYR